MMTGSMRIIGLANGLFVLREDNSLGMHKIYSRRESLNGGRPIIRTVEE
jgi:hypothetical protein